MAWKLGWDSFSVAEVQFKDENVRRFHSFDWPHKFSKKRDRELGLAKLDRLILTTFGNAVKVASVFDLETGRELFRYKDGVKEIPQHPRTLNKSKYAK